MIVMRRMDSRSVVKRRLEQINVIKIFFTILEKIQTGCCSLFLSWSSSERDWNASTMSCFRSLHFEGRGV